MMASSALRKLSVLSNPLMAWNAGSEAVLASPKVLTIGPNMITLGGLPVPLTNEALSQRSGYLLNARMKTSACQENEWVFPLRQLL